MVKKLVGLTSLFLSSSEAASLSSSTSYRTAASWQWPSCTQARTRSFRCDSPEIVSMSHQSHDDEELEHDFNFKTSMNPAYMLDPPADEQHSDSSESLCTAPPREAAVVEEDEDEVIVRSLRANGRLFFEPVSTSSIVDKMRAAAAAAAFDGATALAIDSADPYGDFRRSMEEMVMSHGIHDWGWLEKMLGWYLSANGKSTHGLIVGAFVDMLVALTASASGGAKALHHPVPVINKGKRQTAETDHACIRRFSC